MREAVRETMREAMRETMRDDERDERGNERINREGIVSLQNIQREQQRQESDNTR